MRKEEILKYDYVFEFKPKTQKIYLSDQDKKHMRIIAMLKLIAQKEIERLLKTCFTESFKFEKETQTAYYLIRISKRGLQYADS